MSPNSRPAGSASDNDNTPHQAAAMTKMSRHLAYLLRHNPAAGGLELDESGYTPIADVVAAIPGLTVDLLNQLVDADTKQRFTITGDQIRAAQGHSAHVAPGMRIAPATPPSALFHGTAAGNVPSIMDKGLLPRSRRYVHLSVDTVTAANVASRRPGPHAIVRVDSRTAAADGVVFRRADNGVWLADAIPAQHLEVATPPTTH